MYPFFRRFFGHSSSHGPARHRPRVRLELERLDERLLPSTTGFTSQVMANGQPCVFFVRDDLSIWERVGGAQARQISPPATTAFRVSAGLDMSGQAMVYYCNATSLCALDQGSTYKITDFILSDGAFAASDTSEKVYYVDTHGPVVASFVPKPAGFNTYRLETSSIYGSQVSVGTDLFGKDVAYFLTNDGSNTAYSFTGTTKSFVANDVNVSAGGRNGYFFYTTQEGNLIELTHRGDGLPIELAAGVYNLNGAGTDSGGNVTAIYDVGTAAGFQSIQYNTGDHSYWYMGNFAALPGDGGYDYYIGAMTGELVQIYGSLKWQIVIGTNVYQGQNG